jgi:hypothetical protein
VEAREPHTSVGDETAYYARGIMSRRRGLGAPIEEVLKDPVETPEVGNQNILSVLPIAMLAPFNDPAPPVSARTRSSHRDRSPNAVEQEPPEYPPRIPLEQDPLEQELLEHENQVPIPSDILVEDGAYPTSAIASGSQEHQLPLLLDIDAEDGAYQIAAATENQKKNQIRSTHVMAESSQEAYAPSASIVAVEAGAPKAPAIITSSQGDHRKLVPSTFTPSTEDQNPTCSMAGNTEVELTPVPSIAGEAEKPTTSKTARKKLKETAPQTPSQPAVAEARQRKGASSASIWQRKVQQPYSFRHKCKPTTAQLKGEKLKTSFKKMMGSTEGSDEDFEDLRPLLQREDTKEQEEESVFDVFKPVDSTAQEDWTIVIDSTVQADPTIVIHSTIFIDSTASGNNKSLPRPPDAPRREAGTTNAPTIKEKADYVDLNSPGIVRSSKSKATKSQSPSLDVSNIEQVVTASFGRMERSNSTFSGTPHLMPGPNASTPKEDQHNM